MSKTGAGKDNLPPDQTAARKLARRLVEARRSGRTQGETPARAAAAAADRVYRELARWVGVDGSYALFVRALAQARTDYPALGQVQISARAQPHIDGVGETIMARGDPATAEALEFVLERLIELLGRLIGDDMAAKLIERSVIASERGDGISGNRREQA